MKWKRWGIGLAALLLLAALCAGCSAKAPLYEAVDGNNWTMANGIGGKPQAETLTNTYQAEKSVRSGNEAETAMEVVRKVVQQASLELEAEHAAGIYAFLSEKANELGGYEFSFDIQHYENYSVVNAVVKVPPETLDAFMKFAGEKGKIINQKMQSSDVTDDYYDAQTRVETKRKSLERYYALLADAKTTDEIVRMQNIIDEITEEIEVYEGKLKQWDKLTEMATVTLLIRQENDPVKLKREINWSMLTLDDLGYWIKSAFTTVLSVMVFILQVLLIVLVAGSPLWLAGFLTVCVIRYFRKKRRAKRDAAQEEQARLYLEEMAKEDQTQEEEDGDGKGEA